MLHRKSTAVLFLTFFLLLSITTSARTYYLSSSSGNDSNSGTDPSSPWKTLNKVNSFGFAPGDNILFKRGDTFYGSISISNSGIAGSPITFSAYGSGDKPEITGFTPVSSWANLGGNIWESTNSISSLLSCNMVVINGVSTPMGRYPNAGWNVIGSATSTSISDPNINGTNWTGADVVIRKDRWIIDRLKITSQIGGTLTFGSTSPIAQVGWGYFLQNDPRTLDKQNEWYFNPNTKKIRIYSTSYPSNVKVSTIDVLASIYSKNYIIFDNLSLTGANKNIIAIGSSKYVTVQNCNLYFCGDEAIWGENWSNGNYSNYLTIKNNNFNSNTNKDIDLQNYFENAYIGYNSFKNTGMILGGGPETEPYVASIKTTASNTNIEHNSLDSLGYVGIDFRGNNVIVQKNFISNFCLLKDDGGAIYTFGSGNQYSGQKILNNIIINGIGNNDGTTKLYNALYADGIYMDENTVNVEIGGNTVANCSNAGIFLHNASSNNVHNNLCYNNNEYQLLIQSDNNNVTNNSINGNIFLALKPNQVTGSFKGIKNDIQSFGTFNNNYYARPIDDSTSIQTVENNWLTANDRTLSQWKSYYGLDVNSNKSPKKITTITDLRFEYNASTESKTISLDADYIDVMGNNYDGSITLAPFSSAVLIKNGVSTNLLPAVNVTNPVNGLDYKYYEANSYSALPDFNTASPLKTGTDKTFDLSLANRSTSYSLNFNGYIEVPADGQYTFYTSSDDGSELFIDNIKVVDNDGLHGSVEKSGMVGLKAGKHAISVGFFQETGDQLLSVSYSGPGVSKQIIPDSVLYRSSAVSDLLPAVYPTNTINGLGYTYFEASSYNQLPDFKSSAPVKSGSVKTFDISVANRTTSYSINYKGYIEVPSDGQYTFYSTSDDGSDLYIDNVLVVDNDGLHAALEKSGTIGLKAGKHFISVGFFQQLGDNVLSISYSGPGISKQLVPGSVLYMDANFLPAVYPSNTVNGLDFKYYEADNYTTIPDFNSFVPVKTGTSSNFDISLANRATDYSFNFTGYVNVPSDGEYTFYTTSDDGSTLYIDNVPVVDNDGLHGSRERGGVIGLMAGKHLISVKFFQQAGDNILSVSYEGTGISKQTIPTSALYRISGSTSLLPASYPMNTVNGIDYKYFEADSYKVLPDFNSSTPVKTGSTNTFDISVRNRSTAYSLSFAGYINVPSDGQYTFYTTSDDGSNLLIDNISVVDNNGLHSATERSGTIGLKAGKHLINVGFFQQDGDNMLSVSYEGPGITKQLIPSSALFRMSTLVGQAVMIDQSTGMMFENDSTNFQMQRLLNREKIPGVKVYPNPFKNSIQIDVNGGTSPKFKLTLTDGSGKIVWTKNIENYNSTYHESVNTSLLPVGVYFLSLSHDNKISVTKLVKEY